MSIFRTPFFHSYLGRAKFIFSKALGITSSGAIDENADSVSGVSKVRVYSSGSIFENADTAGGVSTVSIYSAGSINEGSDSVAGVSTTNVFSSGAITENPDTVHSTLPGANIGASLAFKLLSGLLD